MFNYNRTVDCRLDQTLGKPGAWMVSGDNKEKQKMTVVARLSRIETQVGLLLLVKCNTCSLHDETYTYT